MQTLPQSWGIRQEGAVPLTQAEMHTLFSSIHQMLSKTTDQAQQLLLVRDGLLLSILWQACYRGFNATGVRLDMLPDRTWDPSKHDHAAA